MTPALFTLEPDFPPGFARVDQLPTKALRRQAFALWTRSPAQMEHELAGLTGPLSGLVIYPGPLFSLTRHALGLLYMQVPESHTPHLAIGLEGCLALLDVLEQTEEAARRLTLDLHRAEEDRIRMGTEHAAFRESLVKEIDERKRAEEELRRHRDHLEELVRERAAELLDKNNRLLNEIAERKRMEAQLVHLQKMESIGHLAAGIAHEINTPIQFIGDNLQFLQTAFTDLIELYRRYEALKSVARPGSETVLNELAEAERKADMEYLRKEMPKALQQSAEGVQRVAKIVRAMKEFSHPPGEGMTLTDINRAIETTVTIARNEWKYVAEVATELDPALPPVPCLPGDINQVLLNLIVNAAQAIGSLPRKEGEVSGRIVIRTKTLPDAVDIQVADNGPGIPEKLQPKIFTPFFTTKDVGKGTGQGLALAYNIMIKKHHGDIRFETQPGVGTTFIIRLPLAQDSNRQDRE